MKIQLYDRIASMWAICLTLLIPSVSGAAPPVPLSQYELGERPEPIVRLFWQNRDDAQLIWADLMKGKEWSLDPIEVYESPKLDPLKQNLVQMNILDGKLLVGVRDDERGNFQSGWIALDTGVDGHSHGDHIDWHFEHPPEVISQLLDSEQGNPAHLYCYDGYYYLANDTNNGFTQIRPGMLSGDKRQSSKFFSGGGNHITMAAVKNRVGYSTWIDGGGPNAGRVDVVNLRNGKQKQPAYTLKLPTGVIHGATANSGRVFFAPADGVCWVDADLNTRSNPERVTINHIELGVDAETEKPLRTGAFTNHRNYVLFNTGAGESSALCMLDAKSKQPELVKIPIDVPDGLSLTTPQPVFTAAGKRYAFLFQDRKVGNGEEFLTIVDLDPDGNRRFEDSKVVKTIAVGPSEIDGHYGHHSIAFDSDRSIACLTNSGDGTIWVLSLESLEVLAKFDVDGIPDSLLAVGAKSRH